MDLEYQSQKTSFPEIRDPIHRKWQETFASLHQMFPPKHWLPTDVLYGYLQVSREASYDEIYKAYKKRSRRVHPDKQMKQEGLSEEFKFACNQEFLRISEAWRVLRDTKLRKIYDMYGLHGVKHAKILLKQAIMRDPERPEMLELIIAAAILNNIVRIADSQGMLQAACKDEISLRETPKFSKMLFNAALPLIQEKTYNLSGQVNISKSQELTQVVYGLAGEKNINNWHTLKFDAGLIGSTNAPESVASRNFISGGFKYKYSSTDRWKLSCEQPFQMNFDVDEYDSTMIAVRRSKPLVNFEVPILKPKSESLHDAKLQITVEGMGHSIKLACEYMRNIDIYERRRSGSPYSVKQIKLVPFVKFNSLSVFMGSEAVIVLRNDVSIELEGQTKSIIQIKGKSASQNLTHDCSAMCNVPFTRDFNLKFGYKFQKELATGCSMKLLIGGGTRNFTFTLPIEVPNNLLYCCSALALTGAAIFKLKAYHDSRLLAAKADKDDVHAEKQRDPKFEELAQAYRKSFVPNSYEKLNAERLRAENEQREMQESYMASVEENQRGSGLVVEEAKYGIGEFLADCTIPLQLMVYDGKLEFEVDDLISGAGIYDPVPWNKKDKRILRIKYKFRKDDDMWQYCNESFEDGDSVQLC